MNLNLDFETTRPGYECHSLPTVVEVRLLTEIVEMLCLEALEEEPLIWPRFGLVGPTDSGSHVDMNYATLCKSARSIKPYMGQAFALGYGLDCDLRDLFPNLRSVGLEAEAAMFAATEHVNTHKGIIFLLVVLLGSLGRLLAQPRHSPPNLQTWFRLAAEITGPTIEHDFNNIPADLSQTYGEWAYYKFGIKGVRGVVSEEFGLIQKAFRWVVMQPYQSRQSAYSQMRLFFLAMSEDTNIIKRGGFRLYENVRSSAQSLLNQGGIGTEKGLSEVAELEQFMNSKHLSAAAAGDMSIVLLLVVKLHERHFVSS